MKRRIFTFLLAAALVLLTACSSRGTEPPVRIGEATGNASFNRSYSLTEAFEEADVVALVQVGNWLGEKTEGFPYTYYEADALECYKGDIPAHFTLMQNGASTSTYEDYPLFTYGNQLLLFLRHSQTDWGEAYIQYPGAYVNVCSFITTMYVANADDGSRCFVDRFGLMTYEELMNNPGSATLGSRCPGCRRTPWRSCGQTWKRRTPCWRRVFPPGSGRTVSLNPMSIPRTPWRPCLHR